MVHTRARSIAAALAAVLAIAAGAASAAPASAEPRTGIVDGHVVTGDGAPAAGVTLVLGTGHSDEPNHTYRVTTDAAGEYTVSGVASDLYALVLPSDSPWILAAYRSVSVAPGASVTAPTVTVLRPATVHGSVVSAVDGSPVAGVLVGSSTSRPAEPGITDGGPTTRTASDGSFTVVGRPGTVHLVAGSQDWFSAERVLTVGDGAEATADPIALEPAAIVTTVVRGRSGRAIDPEWQTAVVDGCRVRTATPSHCPRAVAWASVDALQVAPGKHTIRYEVRNPVSSIVRHVTRTVVATPSATTALAPVVVRVDPSRLARVHRSSYRRGHRVTVTVDPGTYLDGARPHLRTTFRVNGHAVTPTSVRWRTARGAADVLVATLPERWSTRKTLTVQAVAHGTHAYAGRTSRSQKLVRAH
jgi:hypothetical protein